jgi:colanic acid biosynthesis glycosyl transferase WcaI
MKLFIYGINYSPELTGIGKYTGEMSEWLAEQKHEVEVFTGKPYYPEWKVHIDYKKKWWYTEKRNGVLVHRVPMYVPNKLNSLKRMLHEFSFVFNLLPFWFMSLFQKKADIVIVIAPPFHLGLLPLIYSKIKNTKIIYHIQDLQVDAAKDLGMIKNKSLLSVMFGLEKLIMNQANKVSTISTGMKNKILQKGVNSEKTMLFPNWVDTNFMKPLSQEESMRFELNIKQDDFVVMYSGNLGEKQGLENLIYVAEKFKSEKHVLFLIVGSGGNKENLIQQTSLLNLSNVKFIPLQAHMKLPSLLATANVHLVLQKAAASDLVMPSKLTGILSVGGYCIVAALQNTHLYNVVKLNNLGDVIEPDNIQLLYDAIKNAIDKDLTPYKIRARDYAISNLNNDKLLSEFECEISKIVN